MSEAHTKNNQPLPEPSNSIEIGLTATNNPLSGNRKLQNQVAQLEQALKECREALASQQARSSAQEKLLSKHSEALHTSQEQVTRLFGELESSHQVAQRQQLLIENLSQQLETSHEIIAELEYEIALLDQRYNEQCEQLWQTEKECRELQARLYRQQQLALQFKAALEKVLEAPDPSLETQNFLAARSLLANEQPIPPWAAPPAKVAESGSLISIQRRDLSTQASTSDRPQDETEEMTDFSETEEESAQQLEDESELDDSGPDLSWIFQLLEDPDDDSDDDSEPDTEATDSSAARGTDLSLPQQKIASPENTEEIAPQVKASSADAPAKKDVSTRNGSRLPQSNSPSPLVYPMRPPKRRNSLSAIDLPNFPRYCPSPTEV